jgi:hypothetical protein
VSCFTRFESLDTFLESLPSFLVDFFFAIASDFNRRRGRPGAPRRATSDWVVRWAGCPPSRCGTRPLTAL